MWLGGTPPVTSTTPDSSTTIKEHVRKSRGKIALEDDCGESGLRFDSTVPVEVIPCPPKEIEGLTPEQYEVIDTKYTERLCQRSGSYFIKRFERPVVKIKETQVKNNALLPSNRFQKAANYALEREQGLRMYLEDPNVPIDTNHIEREIRPLPLGRKNWLFCWTEVGADVVAIFQTLIGSCKLHGVNPFEYLVDVLTRIDSHPAARVHELTPREWAQAKMAAKAASAPTL